jgi:hypothetical protein
MVNKMTPKRKAVQDKILKVVSAMDPSGTNVKYYTQLFNSLSDKDFDSYMKRIKDGTDVLPFYAANMVTKIKVKDLVKVAENTGVKLFERIKMYDPITDSYYLTPHEQFVIILPVRKMSQFVDHKLSVAEGDSRIDTLSGQVIKPDQAGSISQIEVQTLYARGLKATISELTKYRGGDVVAFAEFKNELEERGTTSIDKDSQSVARSAVTMDTLFSGMHIESNVSGA